MHTDALTPTQSAAFETSDTTCIYSVAIYYVDRCFGGPEEGGWFYTSGVPICRPVTGIEPLDIIRTFANSDYETAHAHAARVQALLDAGVNAGRPPITSVLSRGRYRAEVMAGLPRYFPRERPRYE